MHGCVFQGAGVHVHGVAWCDLTVVGSVGGTAPREAVHWLRRWREAASSWPWSWPAAAKHAGGCGDDMVGAW